MRKLMIAACVCMAMCTTMQAAAPLNLVPYPKSAWEQSADNEIPSLRWRLPAMCERIYNPDSGRTYADYAKRFERTDCLLDTLFCPVRVDSVSYTHLTLPTILRV